VRDILFIAVVGAFFTLATLFVAACERIIGRGAEGADR
jgi:hypothetical protein